jgi:type IV secretion system protein VirB2
MRPERQISHNHASWSWTLFIFFAVWLVFPDLAQAGGIGDFAGPIDKVVETITGPVGKAVSIIAMALSGYYFITNKEDIAGGAKGLLGTVFGICFIALAAPVVNQLFSFSGAVV